VRDPISGTALDETVETEFERQTLPSGTILAGRYRIDALIGEGGMGDVYRAQHLTIDKPVAIKVLAPEQVRRSRIVSRFLQEARAASRIRHDNVVDITDFGDSDGLVFFVMEFLDGEDLSRLLKREGRLPWARARGIILQILDALAAAHRAGIVHRDIKPHNCVMTQREGRVDFVKLIDFGIAKLRDAGGSGEQLTRTGAIVGTAEYMSPEQGSGTELDGRSDLYSVGVILYRMLTGEVPFAGGNPMAVLYQHIHGVLRPPSVACPDAAIGPELDALVTKALAKDREGRFVDAEDFAAAVRAVSEDGGLARRRQSSRARTWLAVGVAIPAIAIAGWWFTRTPEAPTAAPSTTSAAIAEPPTPVEPPTTPSTTTTPSSMPAVDPPLPTPTPPIVPTPTPTAEPAPPTAPAVPTTRTAKAVRSALEKVGDRVRACGKKAGLFPGEAVTVGVVIAPSGKVTTAAVKGAFNAAGAQCIEAAVRSAKFTAAVREQKLDHRFVL
jgi:serine/threonine protein kinase